MRPDRRSSEASKGGNYDGIVATAGNLFAAHDYEQVVLLLEKIPREQRSAACKRLLLQATQLADEVADLKVRIDDMVSRERFPGLKDALERLVEIRPGLNRYEGYLQAIRTYRRGATYKVRRSEDGSVRFDPAGSTWSLGAVVLTVVVAVLAFGGMFLALRAYFAADPALAAFVLEIDDPGVEIAIDGRPLAADEIGVPVRVVGGEHDLTIRRAGEVVHSRLFHVAEGNRTVLRIRLKDDTPADAPPEAVAATPTPAPPVAPPPTVAEPPKNELATVEPPKVLPPEAPVIRPPGAPKQYIGKGNGEPVVEEPANQGARVTCYSGFFGPDGKETTQVLRLPDPRPPVQIPADVAAQQRATAKWILENVGASGRVVVAAVDGRFHLRRSLQSTGNRLAPLPTAPFVIVHATMDESRTIIPVEVIRELRFVQHFANTVVREGAAERLRVLATLPELRSLFLTFAQTPSDAELEAVGSCRSLERLILGSRRAGPAALKALGSLAALRMLSLSDASGCDDDVAGILASLPSLVELSVHETSLTDRGLAALGAARRLQHLVVTGTPNITGTGLGEIAALPELATLHFENVPLNDAAVARLAACPRLERLKITYAPLGSAIWEPLSRIATLKQLELASTDVGDEGFDALSRLASLRLLHVLNGFVTPEAAQAFHAAHPRCEVKVTLR